MLVDNTRSAANHLEKANAKTPFKSEYYIV